PASATRRPASRSAAPSALRWTPAGRCWSPTTWPTSSGAFPGSATGPPQWRGDPLGHNRVPTTTPGHEMQLSGREARRLMEAGDLASARAVCMAILDRRPDAAHVHLLLGTIARRAGDVGAMRNHIRNARECDAPALALARLEYQLARSIGDNDAELEALDRFAGLEP